ncbi:hypothetical protein [Pseudomonas juntendi]|uniref:hypothetical protein n=1 Tax=Pseudomonas juntendi TaxID=2666183 RepID=UPI002447D163|nr:hypothetical protein [Pseudomonas juntendi]MDG9887169.1 hypothetical protein [Pseudomonas juntendi]
MKKVTFAVLLSASALANADALQPSNPLADYADLLKHAAFECKLKKSLYESAVRLNPQEQDKRRDEEMACIRANSAKARDGFKAALASAMTEPARLAVQDLYTNWRAYFGDYEPLSEARYKRSDAALRTYVASQQ